MLLLPSSICRAGAVFLLVFTHGCGAGGDIGAGECSGLEGVGRCGPKAEALGPERPPPRDTSTGVVHVYVDRSGSMAGYLDAGFEGEFGVAGKQPSLRRVLDRLLTLGSGESRVYGYGQRLVPVQGRSNQDLIATLVRQQFYTDNDTRLEDVLDVVAADTGHAATHVIIGDGRRGDGASAIAQFRRLGTVARAWVGSDAAPGFFAMAVAGAPFRQVRGDKAGCWSTGKATETIRCPLYMFAFGPSRAAPGVLAALRDVATRLYTTPTMTDAAAVLDGQAVGGAGRLNVAGGGRGGRPVELFYTAPGSAGTVRTTVRMAMENSVERFALDDSLTVTVYSAAIAPTAAPWERVRDLSAAWVRPAALAIDAEKMTAALPVDLRSRPQVPKTAYRVDLVSAGVPRWLAEHEATTQGDGERTYGLSALFTQLRPRPTRLATFYARIY